MDRGKLLKDDKINEFLMTSIQESADAMLSFTRQGKWHLYNTGIDDFDETAIALKKDAGFTALVQDQPVGICIQLGHYKYLFESTILSVDAAGRVLLDFPDQVEQVQRRAFERQAVPSNLKVKCLFWHRGYLDESDTVPAEQYWQGQLLNLSAGGAQIAVDHQLQGYFRLGQLVGIQFTPMSFELPLLLEAHVKYLMDQPEQDWFLVGIEFLGLESSTEGREILHRLVQVVNEYERINQQQNSNSLSA